MAHDIITAERLRELLHYDPDTGVFTWLSRPAHMFSHSGYCAGWNRKFKSKQAGYRDADGYWTIRVLGRLYQAHRLAWLYVTGSLPIYDIDHKDGNPSNNSIANLRDVTTAMNVQNRRRPTVGNKSSGLLGVTKVGSRWRAQINSSGKHLHLGYFSAPEVAHSAYLAAKRREHPGCLI